MYLYFARKKNKIILNSNKSDIVFWEHGRKTFKSLVFMSNKNKYRGLVGSSDVLIAGRRRRKWKRDSEIRQDLELDPMTEWSYDKLHSTKYKDCTTYTRHELEGGSLWITPCSKFIHSWQYTDMKWKYLMFSYKILQKRLQNVFS